LSKIFSKLLSYNNSIFSKLIKVFLHIQVKGQKHHSFKKGLSKITANAGLIVKAITKDDKRVVVMINGIEKINFHIIQVINNIAEKIQTTVRVVEINTFLKSLNTRIAASFVVNFHVCLY
jgi:hypothetical protein